MRREYTKEDLRNDRRFMLKFLGASMLVTFAGGSIAYLAQNDFEQNVAPEIKEANEELAVPRDREIVNAQRYMQDKDREMAELAQKRLFTEAALISNSSEYQREKDFLSRASQLKVQRDQLLAQRGVLSRWIVDDLVTFVGAVPAFVGACATITSGLGVLATEGMHFYDRRNKSKPIKTT